MITYLLLYAIIPFGDAKVPCPSPSQGCDCEDAAAGYVTCSGMNALPRNLPSSVTFLDLDSNPVGSALLIHEMANLKNLTLRQLYLSGTGLQMIENRVFMSQPNIRTLDLSNNNFARLDEQMFYGLTQLQTLFLTRSSIFEISSVVFTFIPALKFLDLDGNKLTMVSAEFLPLTNLATLLISSNQISEIADNAFQSQSHLRRLDLFDNKLTTPRKQWFNHLVANNGTLKLGLEGETRNPWSCCGQAALEYKNFLNSLSANLRSRNQYNILCSSPDKFKTQRLLQIDSNELNSCDGATTTTDLLTSGGSISSTQGTPSITDEHKATSAGNGTGGTDFQVVNKGGNMFSRLADGHIVLILLAVIIVAIVVTALAVRQYHVRKKNKAIDEFFQNLPDSRESDEDVGVTTRTYRQDAPVYGSTGNVVDRHRSGFASPPSVDDDSSDDLSKPAKPQRRKPPPYQSEPTSPDQGVDGPYSETHFNNSSSAGMDFLIGNRWRSNTFSTPGYDSDESDDLWDVSTAK